MRVLNKDLRIEIAEIVNRAKEGHIPSSYSILDLINFLYSKILKFKKTTLDGYIEIILFSVKAMVL